MIIRLCNAHLQLLSIILKKEIYTLILYILDTMKLCIKINELCTWNTCRYFLIWHCFQMHKTFLTLIINHIDLWFHCKDLFLKMEKQKKHKGKQIVIIFRFFTTQTLQTLTLLKNYFTFCNVSSKGSKRIFVSLQTFKLGMSAWKLSLPVFKFDFFM